jgi:hypothetical protein
MRRSAVRDRFGPPRSLKNELMLSLPKPIRVEVDLIFTEKATLIKADNECLGCLGRRRTRRDGEIRRGGVKQPAIRRCPNGETQSFGIA